MNPKIDLSQVKYLAFDGTYFHKTGCLIVLMDTETKKYICYEYVKKENDSSVLEMCQKLKHKGLKPKAITVDGHPQVIRAFRQIWPNILVQRCLFHIKLQGQMWLRTYPKTEAGKALKLILSKLMNVKDNESKNIWIHSYEIWHKKYHKKILRLSKTSIASKDLRRAMSLINNALPDIFHFIKDQKIASTTNLLENYFSQLKHQYRCHRGLTKIHKIAYLKWFCYFKNQAK
ncbi:transposase [bacterium]